MGADLGRPLLELVGELVERTGAVVILDEDVPGVDAEASAPSFAAQPEGTAGAGLDELIIAGRASTSPATGR